jgi:hypothetical protein
MEDSSSMQWDPEVESPATIAIVGGGWTGLEVALYARYLGYSIELFDARRIGWNWACWEDRPMPCCWEEATTPLGRAALEAQGEGIPRDQWQRVPTRREFAERYLIALAKSDLLVDFVHFNHRVIDVGRRTVPGRCPDAQERCNDEFRILSESKFQGQRVTRADVLVDSSGWSNHSVGMGPCGSVAAGEDRDAPGLFFALPTYEQQDRWLQKDLLIQGESEEAEELARRWLDVPTERQQGTLRWLVQDPDFIRSDRFRSLETLWSRHAQRAALLCCLGIERLTPMQASGASQARWRVDVSFADDRIEPIEVDAIFHLSYPGLDWSFARSLWVMEPRFLSSAESPEGSQPEPQVRGGTGEVAERFRSIATAEPHYYVLGSKRSNNPSGQAFRLIREQIRSLFAVLGDREGLDLYAVWESRLASS